VLVLVVGAGLAGLSACESLIRSGVDVHLVEAGRRFGGRVRTVHDRFANGQYAESGAEWVDTIHHRMHQLMDRFGVGTIGPGLEWTTIRRWLFWDAHLYSESELSSLDADVFGQVERYEAAVDSHAKAMSDPTRPSSHPDAIALDRTSLADVMNECRLGAAARLFAQRNSEGEFASDPARVSLLFVAQQRAQEELAARELGVEVRAHRVDGGLTQIPVAWGAEIAAHRQATVEFGRSVIAVDQDADRVSVQFADGHSTTADVLVLATSLVPLRRIDWRTTPPVDLERAIRGLGYGTITKTAVQFDRRDWEPGYGTTSSVSQRLYDCSVDQAGESGILMSYCGGEGGLRLGDLDEVERIATITDDMRRVHGITTRQIGAFSRSWAVEPGYGGAYAVYEPGQVTEYWDALRRPFGRIHLAGEHVATCTGYMEGAVESGRTIAERILAGQ
jgi:monoamine oxidase